MTPRAQILALLATLALTGCAANPQFPTPAALAEQARRDANMARAQRLLDSGDLHANQPLPAALALCEPLIVTPAGRYTFLQFHETGDIPGLMLISVDGALACATTWTCETAHDYFDRLTLAERTAALNVYEASLDERRSR